MLYKYICISLLFTFLFYLSCNDDTEPTSPNETETLTDVDGNTYNTVKIGNQVWMTENLKVTHYRNSDVIPNITVDSLWVFSSSGAHCNYNNDLSNIATYGLLYNWHAVYDSGGIAPEGWHVPTDEEWKELEMYLGLSQDEANAMGNRGTIGNKLKEAGTAHWDSTNTEATNESGFTALPNGYRYSDTGTFGWINERASFWTSSERDSLSAIRRILFSFTSSIHRYYNDKTSGFGVRCIKD